MEKTQAKRQPEQADSEIYYLQKDSCAIKRNLSFAAFPTAMIRQTALAACAPPSAHPNIPERQLPPTAHCKNFPGSTASSLIVA
jgi:pterin-4a-carbinolamine dehydratase